MIAEISGMRELTIVCENLCHIISVSDNVELGVDTVAQMCYYIARLNAGLRPT